MSGLKRKKDRPSPGQHRWLLLGRHGAVQFVALEEAGPHLARTAPSACVLINGRSWMGCDVGRHSPRPLYEDEPPMDGCDVLEGQCFYDGSSLQAHTVLGKWAESGCDEEVIWAELAEYYEAWLVAK